MDDLGEGAAFDGVAIVEISQSVSIFYCRQVIKLLFFDSCIIIAIDDGRVAFAKVGGTVCLVADAVGRDILILIVVRDIVVRRSCGTDRRAGAFSINVCVDNGITGAAVDVDVAGTAIDRIYLSANCRPGVTGSIKRRIIVGAKGVDRIYGAAGNVDGCCTVRTVTISNRGTVIGTDGGNVGIFFNIDREIPGIAVLTGTDGAASLTGFCMYGGIPGDRNGCSRAIPAAVQTAITNGGTPSTVSINNGMVRNGDAVSAAGTAADCSALCMIFATDVVGLFLYYTTLMEITLINWMRNNCL